MNTSQIPFYVDRLTVTEGTLWLHTKQTVKCKVYDKNYDSSEQTFYMPNITVCVTLDREGEFITLSTSKGLDYPSHPNKDNIDFVVYDESHVKIMNSYGLSCRFSKDVLECPWIDGTWNFHK